MTFSTRDERYYFHLEGNTPGEIETNLGNGRLGGGEIETNIGKLGNLKLGWRGIRLAQVW